MSELLTLLLVGYAASVALETPVLLVGLSARHSLASRLAAGCWLTACTYPVVILVLPPLFASRATYLVVAETFAPSAECLLFWAAFAPHDSLRSRSLWRDFAAVTLANLASFAAGEWLHGHEWFGLFGA